VSFFESRGKNNYDDAYAASTMALQYNRTKVQKFSLYANNRFTNNWISNVRLSQYTDRSQDYDSEPLWTDGYSLYQARTKEVSWQNNIHTSIGQFVAGVSRTHQRLTTDSEYSNTFRGTTSLWAGYVLDKDRHHAQLNVRTDKISNFSRQNTASVNYGFDLDSSWRVLAGYSNGFSAPTLNDLYSQYGNPTLNPEYANYTQLGVQYSGERLTARVTGFENRYRDKIAYANGSTQNIARAKAQGIEWNGSYNRDGWVVDAGFTYQEVKNSDTGATLLRQPRVLASLGLGKSWGKWQTQMSWQAQGSMKDISNSTVEGFGTLNAVVFYAPIKEVKVGLTVNNVFNRDYQTLYGYNGTPRTVLLSLQYQPTFK
jgi:vitamin B12 transporter